MITTFRSSFLSSGLDLDIQNLLRVQFSTACTLFLVNNFEEHWFLQWRCCLVIESMEEYGSWKGVLQEFQFFILKFFSCHFISVHFLFLPNQIVVASSCSARWSLSFSSLSSSLLPVVILFTSAPASRCSCLGFFHLLHHRFCFPCCSLGLSVYCWCCLPVLGMILWFWPPPVSISVSLGSPPPPTK